MTDLKERKRTRFEMRITESEQEIWSKQALKRGFKRDRKGNISAWIKSLIEADLKK